METKFFASIRSKAGRILFASQAHASREDAARECFAARPKAHEASTSRAGFINGEYRDCGSDIQWILRRNVMTAQPCEAQPTMTKARKGDLALVRYQDSGYFTINPYRHVPGKSGFRFAIVESVKRDGLVRVARCFHGWPSVFTGPAVAVAPALKIGDAASLVSELTEIYPTTEAAQIAMRQWIALHKETA